MHEGCFESAVENARQYAVENDMTFMHPFDDRTTIAGYASMAIEIMEDCQ